MSAGCLVPVFTSIVDTVPLPKVVTKAVLPSGVTATPLGFVPTVMSSGCLVLVFMSIVDTVSLWVLPTRAVLPPRASAIPPGDEPTVMFGGVLSPLPHVDRGHRAAARAEVLGDTRTASTLT